MTQYKSFEIQGAWLITTKSYTDNRGVFSEKFKSSEIAAELGIDFTPVQVNESTSKAGVVRGIHWSLRPNGQKKYVTCASGKIWDVFVDLRIESPTFGKWGSTYLEEGDSRSLLLDEGIGHSFLALADDTRVNYLVSSEYAPELEKSICPLDVRLSINFFEVAASFGISKLLLSDKDEKAPTFHENLNLGNYKK